MVDPGLRDFKIVAIGEMSRREFIPQMSGSWERAASVELIPYKHRTEIKKGII